MKSIFITMLFSIFSVFGFSQTQAEMNAEASEKFKNADAVLSKTYKKVMAMQDAAGKKLLLEAQRAWIKYKEAHCKSACLDNIGGSIYALVYYSCLTEQTEERIKHLNNYLTEE